MRAQMSDYPLHLGHAFARAERMFWDKPLVESTPGGMRRTTYGAWAERTRRLAGALDDLGVSPGGRVGTFAWNTIRHLELYFAVPCARRVLHTINVRLSGADIAWIVEHAEDEALFVDRSLLHLVLPILDEMQTVRAVVVMDDHGETPVPDDPRFLSYERLIAGASPARFVAGDELDAAAMCFTSGTTGRPKGVVYSHRSAVLHALGVMSTDGFAVAEADTVLPLVPMFHVNAWGLPHACVMAGATLVMPGSDLSPLAVATLLESERVTLAAAVPTVWQGVLPELEGRRLADDPRIVSGGAATPVVLSEAYREQLGFPLLQAWGMTETSPIAATCRIKSTLQTEGPDRLAERRATVGRPGVLVDARIVDPEGAEQPWDGEATGELQVRGPWITAAYHGGVGASQFTSDGWLRTGDVARIDAHGYIRLVDRIKDLVKSAGEWISSVDLENAIMSHPAVREAAVIAVPDERWGERPLACVVLEPEHDLSAQDLRTYLRARVAKWWVPERIEFIDEVPKTSVGKFAKRDLRDRFATQGPDPEDQA